MNRLKLNIRQTSTTIFQWLVIAVWCANLGFASAATLTLDDIDARISDISSRYGAGDPNRARLSAVYANVRDLLLAERRHLAAAANYEAMLQTGAASLSELQSELRTAEGLRERAGLSVRERALSTPTIEQELREAESRQSLLTDDILALDKKERELLDRPALVRARREELTAQIAALEAALRSPIVDTNDDVTRALRVREEAKISAHHAELSRLDQELLSHAIQTDLIDAERAAAQAKLDVETLRIAELRELLLSRRRDVADAIIEETLKAQQRGSDEHPLLRRVLDENAALAHELASLVDHQATIADRHLSLQQRHAELASDFDRIQERLRYIDHGTELGQLLIDHRRRIPHVERLQRRFAQTERWISSLGVRSLELEDQDRSLADISTAVSLILEGDGKADADESLRAVLRTQLAATLTKQQDLLGRLANDYRALLSALAEHQYAAQRFIAIVRSFADYLDNKIIWIPNASLLNTASLLDATRGVRWVLSPQHWVALIANIIDGVVQAPVWVGLWLLALAALVWLRRRLQSTLDAWATRVRNIRTDRFRYTLGALVASLVFAGLWPLAMWLTSRLIRLADSPSEFSLAIASGLISLAPITYFLVWLRRLMRPNGVGRRHFRWRDNIASEIFVATRHFAMVFLPAHFLAVVLAYQGNSSFHHSLGRLAFVLAMVSAGAFVYRLIRPRGALGQYLHSRYSDRFMARAFPSAGIITVVLIGLLALLAIAGYYYTARNLYHYLLLTGMSILLALVLRSSAIRWLSLAESRLALRRARERQEATAATDADGARSPGSADDPPIDIATINNQTRMMLSNVIAWSLAIALYFIWHRALPTLGILESVVLWEIGTPGDGIQVISLATALIAAIIIAITVIAAKNLPGVLEIGLLQRLPLQPGSRYAITTLSQYAIVAVGIIVAVSALGARWSQIQWLVAALSVGLGFGLQEIVANFISGLILLFERPIRVGDTVTIGELTGNVTRIRIRATTIVDWDNKEIVVPNKNFITERFVNWTLSDPVIRVVIKVGIAYGSDVEKALETMYAAIKAQEKVLSEPAPRALFLGFGDSSLDFEILVYIRDMADRLVVRHGLHTAINRGFAEAGIAIPFPQRDLHIRSTPDSGRVDTG